MTAFNEVLTAEQEAVKTINTAQEVAVAATVQARTDHRSNVEAEVVKLQQAEDTALATNQVKVDAMVKKIETDVNSEVSAAEKRFGANQAELKSLIKKSF